MLSLSLSLNLFIPKYYKLWNTENGEDKCVFAHSHTNTNQIYDGKQQMHANRKRK